MSYACWVIDDEPAAHKALQLAIKSYPDFTIEQNYYAIDELPNSRPDDLDVVFLDIEMPRATGFALFERWQAPYPIVVFVTAYNQYAIKAFEHHAFDYLLKPLEEKRVEELFSRLLQRLKEQKALVERGKLLRVIESIKDVPRAVSIKTDDGIFRVPVEDIYYLEAVGDFVAVHLQSKSLLTRSTLKALILEINCEQLVQVHKSFAAHLIHVEKLEKGKFGDGKLLLTNGALIKMSRRYKQALK